MDEYDEEREGSCLMPLLIGIVLGILLVGGLKAIISLMIWIGSHF